ncbi:hypothetical protein [Veillonella sp.]|uniref:hypothetical protein n=1 Tax=Veillonella sp. TaxID=1926307 RepID=UPI0025E5E04C|nr:hypothetical protein [Veillonella sp.]
MAWTKIIAGVKNYGKTIIIAVSIIIAIVGLWYCFCKLSDNGSSINDARTQFERIRTEQSEATEHAIEIESGLNRSTEGLETVRNEIERSTESIGRVKERGAAAEEIIEHNQKLIRDSREILEQIRKKGKSTE